MRSFVLKNLLTGVVLVLVIVTVTFVLMSVTGTDVARNIAGQYAADEQIAVVREQLGLDDPLPVRYLAWIGAAVTGDLGSSWFSSRPVSESLLDGLPVTLSILGVGLVVSAVLSVAFGVLAAVRGGWIDRSVQLLSVLGFALPSFLVALVLSLVFAVRLGWFPAVGFTTFAESPVGWLSSVLLPGLALAVGAVAATAQQVRGALVDVLATDYVRTLRSRGLPTGSILFRHALRNASPPGLTVLALQFIGLVGGAVVVEKVFGLAGLGTLVFSASSVGDQPLVLGVVAVMVLMVVAVNLLLDLAYGWLNPKVRTR